MFTFSLAGISCISPQRQENTELFKVVLSGPAIATYLIQLSDHSPSVPEHAYLRPGDVVPSDGDLFKPEAVVLGNIKELDVKTEPVDRHQAQQWAELDHVERLKPALCINELQA